MKHLLLLTISVTLALAMSTTANSASAIKGKIFYKRICQSCHIQGGEAKVIVPSDKKMEEWESFFEVDQHSARPEAWENLSRKKRKDLLLFLMNYAIDSEQPDECG